MVVVLGEDKQIKETHRPLCETGSELGPYLKDLHPAGTLFLCVLWGDTYAHFCCYLPSAEGNQAVLGSVYELIAIKGEGESGGAAGRLSSVESLSQALDMPGHLIRTRALRVSINLSSGGTGACGLSSAMIHLGQLCVCMCMCLCIRGLSLQLERTIE